MRARILNGPAATLLVLAAVAALVSALVQCAPIRLRRSAIPNLEPCTVAGPYPGYNDGLCLGAGIVIEWRSP